MIITLESSTYQHSVLFICAANQCRSVMAEYGLKSLVKKLSLNPETWMIGSAGVNAFAGLPATSIAIQVIREIQEDATYHCSQRFTCQLGEQYALILCMQKTQQNIIQQSCPILAQRVHLITSLVGLDNEIDDPFGLSLTSYQETMRSLLSIIANGWENLVRLSSLQY